jgi:hypothetical protein
MKNLLRAPLLLLNLMTMMPKITLHPLLPPQHVLLVSSAPSQLDGLPPPLVPALQGQTAHPPLLPQLLL